MDNAQLEEYRQVIEMVLSEYAALPYESIPLIKFFEPKYE